MRQMALDQRLDRLERTVRRQRLLLSALGLGGAAAVLMALSPAKPGTIEARAIRIVDAAGKPRILIGAPPPADGRQRKDAGTASIVVLGPTVPTAWCWARSRPCWSTARPIRGSPAPMAC